jgi:hypothetical protein
METEDKRHRTLQVYNMAQQLWVPNGAKEFKSQQSSKQTKQLQRYSPFTFSGIRVDFSRFAFYLGGISVDFLLYALHSLWNDFGAENLHCALFGTTFCDFSKLTLRSLERLFIASKRFR